MSRYRILIGMMSIGLLCWIGTGEAAFELTGSGARSMGLGGAYLALSEDVDGIWHNPSGMAAFEGMEVQLNYALPYGGLGDDLSIGSVGLLKSMGGLGNLGVGLSMLSSDVWKEQVFVGSLSREFGALGLGGSFKMLMWSAEGGTYGADLSKTGMTLDVGGIYCLGGMLGFEGIRLGVLLSNLLPANISDAGDDGGKLPMGIGLGVGLKKGNSLTSMELRMVGGDMEVRGGVEVMTTGMCLRLGGLGIANAEDMPKGEVDFGIGIALKGLQLDYAYTYPLITARELGGHQLFSLGYKF